MKTLIISLLMPAIVLSTLPAQADRISDAKAVAKTTRDKAAELGKSLANTKTIELLNSLDDSRKNILIQLVNYNAIIGTKFEDLRARIISLNSNIGQGTQDKAKIQEFYKTLKDAVRERYEMSWSPTLIDNNMRMAFDNFRQATSVLEQHCASGTINTKQFYDAHELFTADHYNEPVGNIPHDCQFLVRAPNLSANTDSGSQGGGGVQQTKSANSDDWGDFRMMCYGPYGSNDLVGVANGLGYATMACGALYAAGVAVAATIGMATLGVGLVVAAIAAIALMGQVDEETRSIIFANEIKMSQSATATDVVNGYRDQCYANLGVLKQLDHSLDNYMSSDPNLKNQALAEHKVEKEEYSKLKIQLTNLENLGANQAQRLNPDLKGQKDCDPAKDSSCTPQEKAKDPSAASKDAVGIANAAIQFKFESLMKILKYDLVEADLKIEDSGLRKNNQKYWAGIDNLLDVTFSKFIKLVHLQNATAATVQDSRFRILEKELTQTGEWLGFRKNYLILCGQAIDVIFGERNKAQFLTDVSKFHQGLAAFAKAHPSLQSEIDVFLASLVQMQEVLL